MACSPALVSVSQCGHTHKLTHPHTEAPMWGMPLLSVDAATGVPRVVRKPRRPKGRPRRTSAQGTWWVGKALRSMESSSCWTPVCGAYRRPRHSRCSHLGAAFQKVVSSTELENTGPSLLGEYGVRLPGASVTFVWGRDSLAMVCLLEDILLSTRGRLMATELSCWHGTRASDTRTCS